MYQVPTTTATQHGTPITTHHESSINHECSRFPLPKPTNTPPPQQPASTPVRLPLPNLLHSPPGPLPPLGTFLPRTTHHKLHVIIRKHQPARDLIKYLHAACFSPVPSTWIQAIKANNFITWPGLTIQLVKKHLPLTEATIQGHIHRQRQKLQSTSTTATRTSKK